MLSSQYKCMVQICPLGGLLFRINSLKIQVHDKSTVADSSMIPIWGTDLGMPPFRTESTRWWMNIMVQFPQT